MDEILATLKSEIALDCEEGSSLHQLWTYVEQAQQAVAQRSSIDIEGITVDDSMKQYLWPFICKLEGLIFKNGADTIYDSGNLGESTSDTATRFLSLPFRQVADRYPNLVVRASQPAIYKALFGKTEGLEKVTGSALTYKIIQMLARARDKGVSQVQLSKDLNVDPRSCFHYIKTLDKLGLVIKSATFQNGVNTNLVVLRRLANAGYVTGKPSHCSQTPVDAAVGAAAGENGSAAEAARAATNAPSREQRHIDLGTANFVRRHLRKRISDLLEASETGYMVEIDLIDTLGLDIWNIKHRKYFHRVIRDLISTGHIDCIRMQVPDESLATNNGENEGTAGGGNDVDLDADNGATQQQKSVKRRRRRRRTVQRQPVLEGHSIRRCIRLLKPYVEKARNYSSLGVPLRDIQNEGLGELNGIEDAEDEDEDEDNASSDDEIPDVEAVKEKDDIRYMLSKPQVRIGLLHGLSFEAQIFRLVALSGSHGIVAKAIQFLLHEPNFKMVARSLSHLERTPVVLAGNKYPGLFYPQGGAGNALEISEKEMLVTAVEEFMGREHRKRYFVNQNASNIVSLILVDSLNAGSSSGDIGDSSAIAGPHDSDSRMEQQQAHIGESTEKQPEVSASNDVEIPNNSNDAHNAAVAVADTAAGSGGGGGSGSGGSSGGDDKQMAAPATNNWDHVRDCLNEASKQGMNVNTFLRGEVILRMLEDQAVISCSYESVGICESLFKECIAEKHAKGEIPTAVAKPAMKHSLDKRTFLRTVMSLADQDRLWVRHITGFPSANAKNVAGKVTLAIARSMDPDSSVVDSFISILRDRNVINSRSTNKFPRFVNEVIPIERTEGADIRDRLFNSIMRGAVQARIENLAKTNTKLRHQSSVVDSGMRKRPRDADSLPLSKRARVTLVDRTIDGISDPAWAGVLRRVEYYPKKLVRMMLLYDFLIDTLPDNVDMRWAYPNYTFCPNYFFYEMPLELYVVLCGGIKHFPAVRRYIRYGVASDKVAFFDDEEQSSSGISDAEGDEDGEDGGAGGSSGWKQGTVDEMNERLATPISKLPTSLCNAFRSSFNRARIHFQPIIYAMLMLQLVRPLSNIKELMTMPPPMDCKDVFANAIPGVPNCLSCGYQIVGKARMLNAEGLMKSFAKSKDGEPQQANLAIYYYDDKTYNMLDKDGRFRYWSDLAKVAKVTGKDLPANHILYGIHRYYYWKQHVTLTARQIDVLNEYANQKLSASPLSSYDLLCKAANQAGVTPADARKFYTHLLSKWEILENKRASVRERQLKRLAEQKAKAKKLKDQQERAKDQGEFKGSRRHWSYEESMLVAIAYVLLRHHARSHEHVFTVKPIAALFPERSHTKKPIDAIRHHWIVMRHKPHNRKLTDNLELLWAHVLDDAVEKGFLEDNEDIEEFDLHKAARYFYDLIQEKTIEALLEKYSQEIEEARNRAIELASLRGSLSDRISDRHLKEYPARPRKSNRRAREKRNADEDGLAASRPKRSVYLPATMDDFMRIYAIDASDARPKPKGIFNDFHEDIFKDGMSTRAQQRNSYNDMLTTHQSWACMGDGSNPVITYWDSDTDRQTTAPSSSAGGMEVGSRRESRVSKREPLVPNTPFIPYTDVLGTMYPVERHLDASHVVEQVSLVLNGSTGCSDDGGGDVNDVQPSSGESSLATAGSGSTLYHNSVKNYVSAASLQPMILNLILTPESEYDVKVGDRLLYSDADVSSKVLSQLDRCMVITKLKGFAMSVGLEKPASSAPKPQERQAAAESEPEAASQGEPSTANKPDTQTEESAAELSVSNLLSQAIESTVMVHETTGTTRVNAKAAEIGNQADDPNSRGDLPQNSELSSVQNGSEGGGGGGSSSNGASNDGGDSSSKAPEFGPRNVPGRGFSMAERFLKELKGTLPAGFIKPPLEPGCGYDKIDGTLEPGDFALLFSLIAQCKAWIRPIYSNTTSVELGGLAGFKKQSITEVIDFDLKLLTDPAAALDANHHRGANEGIENPAPETKIGLSDDDLAVAKKVTAAVVDLAGPIGVTLVELGAVFSKILCAMPAIPQLTETIRLALQSNERLALLLLQLARQKLVYVVGSTDRRYVSDKMYRQHWTRTIEGVPATFVPYMGQSLSGSVSTTYMVRILAALVGRILDNPGITQMKLLLRYFAPFISKAELLRYLDILCDLGIIYARTAYGFDEEQHLDPAAHAGITSYWTCADYYLKLAQLPSSAAVTSLELV